MDVAARIVTLELAETFTIARDSTDTADVVVVELRHDGTSGYGEGAPIDRYDETATSARTYVEEHAELLGDDPFALEEIMRRLPEREFAARAAIDGALHDLAGKLAGQPVHRLLGLPAARAADVVDHLARRSGRHGAARGEGRRPLQAAEAQARRR